MASACRGKVRPCSAATTPIGEVTSGTFSPTFERPIAMAYVQPAAQAPGTRLAVDIRGTAVRRRRRAAAVLRTRKVANSQYSANCKELRRETGRFVVRQDARMGRRSPTKAARRSPRWASRAFAVEALTDLVFIELPKVGRQVQAGESFCEVESVKAVSDVYAPVAGEVVAVNGGLRRRPRHAQQGSRTAKAGSPSSKSPTTRT